MAAYKKTKGLQQLSLLENLKVMAACVANMWPEKYMWIRFSKMCFFFFFWVSEVTFSVVLLLAIAGSCF